MCLEMAWAPIDDNSVVKAQAEWLNKYYDAMQQYVQQESYVNFPNRELTNWAQKYYGSILTRLSEVKSWYDPDKEPRRFVESRSRGPRLRRVDDRFRHPFEIAGEIRVHDILSGHRLAQLRRVQDIALDDANARRVRVAQLACVADVKGRLHPSRV